MFSRIIQWYRDYLRWRRSNEEWTKEHELAWPPAKAKRRDGMNSFQAMCEKAVTDALQSEGILIVEREVETKESYIRILTKVPHWAIYIFNDTADISSEKEMLVHLEEWDTRSPQEFTNRFVEQMLAEHQKWKQTSV